MTENNRFSITQGYTDRVCYDWQNNQLLNFRETVALLNELAEENTRLKERNNRQAKQLDNLYNLIEKQDWETLKGLIQEFQECEEQLQKEWGTYGDFEW